MVKIHLPRSRPHQRKVLTASERFKVIVCGRRWGKTDAAFQAVVLGHGPRRGHLPGMIDGAEIAWVVPVNKNARKVWAMLKRALSRSWKSKNEKDKRIELPNGGAVTVISTEQPDNVRSEGYDGMVCDEASRMKDAVFRSVLRPMLVDRMGWCVFITTPNGTNWFKRDVWDRAENRNGWARWQLPTSDNPQISQKELDEALLDLGPHMFAQEHLAQFVAQEGAEFPPEWFEDSIWFDEWPDPQDMDSVVIALDPSLGKNEKADYSAYVTLKRHGPTALLYVDADLAKRVPPVMVDDGIQLARIHKPHAFGVETVAFQSLLGMIFAAESKRAGLMLPIWELGNSKPSKIGRIRRLTPFLSRGEFRFKRGSPGAEMLVEQLQAFPVAEYDDGPDALEMAWRITNEIWATEPPREETTNQPVRFKG